MVEWAYSPSRMPRSTTSRTAIEARRTSPPGCDLPVSTGLPPSLASSSVDQWDLKCCDRSQRYGDNTMDAGIRDFYLGQRFNVENNQKTARRTLSSPHPITPISESKHPADNLRNHDSPTAADAPQNLVRRGGGQSSALSGDQESDEEDQGTESARSNPGETMPLPLVVDGKPVTTLLVRNICRRLVPEDVLRYWPCHHYSYSLLYVAYDIRKNRGSGHLFIDFETPQSATAFYDQFQGRVCASLSVTDQHGDMKPLEIKAAQRQGFQPNVSYWQQTLRHDVDTSLLPVIFISGFRHDFLQYVHSAAGDDHYASPVCHQGTP